MRPHATLAMLTAVLLLLVSCVASACSASCGLHALAGGCHAHASMAGMQHCGVDNPGGSAFAAHTGECAHGVCIPPALPGERNAAGIQTAPQHTALLVPLPALPVFSRLRSPETPPGRAPSVVSLQTVLRV